MRIRILLLSLLLLAAPGLATESDIPQERMKDVQAIRDITNAWLAAYQSGNIDNLLELYVPDATLYINEKHAVRGTDAIRSYFEPRLGQYDFDVTTQHEEYLFHGDLIIDVSLVWIDGTNRDTGEAFQDAVRSFVVFRRTDAGWKIYRDIDQHTRDTG
ncbi:MAG: DUF4440 domain-containing protein [Gammaproteobacteria bacterium]|nr:DUF4440 domain-containing protein [Gammaproteobacteria bacterium]